MFHVSKFVIFSGLMSGIILGGCKPRGSQQDSEAETKAVEGTPGIRVDPIDVSFLLPRAGKIRKGVINADRARIRISEGLLSPDQFKVVHDANFNKTAAKNIFGTEAEIYQNTFISGVRFDPCPPQAFTLTGPAKCEEGEFRLVAQYWNPVPATDKNPLADAGLHLVYKMKDSGVVLKELQSIFRSNDLPASRTCNAFLNDEGDKIPVGPHPCLVGIDSNDSNDNAVPGITPDDARPLIEKLKVLILKNATPEKLKGVAIMVTKSVPPPEGGTRWEWKITATNRTTGQLTLISPMFMLKDKPAPDNVGFNALGSNGSIFPTSAGVGSEVVQILGSNPADQNRSNGLDAARSLENPRLTKLPSPAGLPGPDCTGCHVQTMAKIRLKVKPNEGRADLEFRPAGKGAAAGKGILNKMHDVSLSEYTNSGNYIVLNFGYHPASKSVNAHPAINQRTINETAEVVRFINQ